MTDDMVKPAHARKENPDANLLREMVGVTAEKIAWDCERLAWFKNVETTALG